MSIAKDFAKYIGKKFDFDLREEIEPKIKGFGYSLSVLDPTFPKNIDVNPKRLNFVVDENFIIRKINVG